MKKFIVIAAVATLTACNSGKTEETTVTTTDTTTVTVDSTVVKADSTAVDSTKEAK